jgi:hypothetical protein
MATAPHSTPYSRLASSQSDLSMCNRGDIDAVIDYMIKGGESVVHMHGFVFDREALGKLVLSLSKFVDEDHGVINRSDPAGDIRMTVDFSHIIPPSDLNI